MKSNLLGIGGQRCATTWLFQCLIEHPEVCSNEGKEINFFSDHFHRGYEWYERKFLPCKQYKIRCDYSVSYLYNCQAAIRAYKYDPMMKVIVCLRNPIDRAFDQHLWHVSLGLVTGANLNFENAIKNNPMYVEQGRYYKYLKEWTSFFPLYKNLLPIIVDDIKTDSEKTIRSIYNFLEIDPNYTPFVLNREINTPINMRFPSVKKLIRKTSASIKNIGGKFLIDYLKKYNANGMLDVMNSKKNQAGPFLDLLTKEQLRKSFIEDNVKLSELIERDVVFWSE